MHRLSNTSVADLGLGTEVEILEAGMGCVLNVHMAEQSIVLVSRVDQSNRIRGHGQDWIQSLTVF